jgi:hypothetical protein
MKRLISFVLVVLVCALMPCTGLAQQKDTLRIVETVWGFDGRVVFGQFMPLSILVDNLSDQPIEGVATLRTKPGLVTLVGGVSSQAVFIGPGARRWIQFYPYIRSRSTTSYVFAIETEEHGTFRFDDIDQPRVVLTGQDHFPQEDAEARTMPSVILDPPGLATRAPTTIKHMPAEIFPPYATATRGLFVLFLDDVPDWEAPRQEALLSWLKAGGRLHLLLDANRQTLRFSGPLSQLNEPFPQFNVGSGRVFRHDIQRAELTSQIVGPAVSSPEAAEDNSDDAAAGIQARQISSSRRMHDDEVFGLLREVTQPEHAWPLIVVLSLIYVGLIFPGCWILSKQHRMHYLVTYGALTGLSLLFSLVFLFIGRRGYGEATSVHSLALAIAEDATHWNAFQYSSVFVTSGRRYHIEDNDHQSLFSSGADEAVDARIVSGNTALFDTIIPPFASQAILSRRRLQTEDWGMSVVSSSVSGDELSELTVSVNEKFPMNAENQYFAIYGQQVHFAVMDSVARTIRLQNRRDQISSFCNPDPPDYSGTMTPFGFQQSGQKDRKTSLEKCFESGLKAMMARSLTEDFVNDPVEFRLPNDQVRIAVWAPFSTAADLTLDAEARRDGRVLYLRTLPVQAGLPVSSSPPG